MSDKPELDLSNLPDLDPEIIRNCVAQKRFAEGFYQLVATAVTTGLSNYGWVQFELEMAPLREENKESSKSSRDSKRVWLDTPYFMGGSKSDTPVEERKQRSEENLMRCVRTLRALLGSDALPRPPVWNKERKAFMFPDGRAVDQQAANAFKLEAATSANVKIRELLGDPSKLEGCAAYNKMYYTTDKEGKPVTRLSKQWYETLPAETTLVPAHEWLVPVPDAE